MAEATAILGNEWELREVFTNLLINAFDALSGGGTVRVRTASEEEVVVIEISDNGAGMSPEMLERCFEPFYTTKGDAGTGIGLAVVAATVERHGGMVDIQSEVGVGATVAVRLPAAKRVGAP